MGLSLPFNLLVSVQLPYAYVPIFFAFHPNKEARGLGEEDRERKNVYEGSIGWVILRY